MNRKNNHTAALSKRQERLDDARSTAKTMLEDGWDKKTVAIALVNDGIGVREAKHFVNSIAKKPRKRHLKNV